MSWRMRNFSPELTVHRNKNNFKESSKIIFFITHNKDVE